MQLWGDRLVVSHYLPVVRPLERWRHDGRHLVWVREAHGLPFGEAVRLVPDGAHLALDLKDDRGDGAWRLAERLVSEEVDRRRCLVVSKHWDSVGWLGSLGFRAWRTAATRDALRRLLAAGPDARCAGVSVRHTSLTPTVVSRLQAFGEVVAWTVPTPSRARELASWGVGGIVADDPAVLAAARQSHPAVLGSDEPGPVEMP